MDNKEFGIYKDIQSRTNGEIYIGVVGPVRTGKSTFIKKFMELCVLPHMSDNNDMKRLVDELPQSAQGKTIMTTEPKFIPKEAAGIYLDDNSIVKIRMVDCVGFLVDGADGYMEGDNYRMVKTPWQEEDMTFKEAASIGTTKVIRDHSTIGIMVTCDGSFGELKRENYVVPEEETVRELKNTGKPFVIVLNTIRPFGNDTISLKKELEEKFGTLVIPLNCNQMQKNDAIAILHSILMGFPIKKINYIVPKWTEMLPNDNDIKQNLLNFAFKLLKSVNTMKSLETYCVENNKGNKNSKEELTVISNSKINLSDGSATVTLKIDDKFYYQYLSNITGTNIESEYQLMSLIRDLTEIKKEYDKIEGAFISVKQKGYGVVMPELNDITMQDPQLITHGSKYGVKMKAVSPSIHVIRANIETEIAPIVGSKEQAEDLIEYIKSSQREDGVWSTNIFGKTIGELMEDGIHNKISQMDDECQMNLQDTMQKIVNDTNGGMICFII